MGQCKPIICNYSIANTPNSVHRSNKSIEWPWRSFITFGAFQVQVVYICAAIYQISTSTPAPRGPSATAGLLVFVDTLHFKKSVKKGFRVVQCKHALMGNNIATCDCVIWYGSRYKVALCNVVEDSFLRFPYTLSVDHATFCDNCVVVDSACPLRHTVIDRYLTNHKASNIEVQNVSWEYERIV